MCAALAIRKQVLGEWHPGTATFLNNLAQLLKAKGEYDEAEPLYRQALAILERVLPNHPNTLRCRDNLAGLLDKKEKASGSSVQISQPFSVSPQVDMDIGVNQPLAAQQKISRNGV